MSPFFDWGIGLQHGALTCLSGAEPSIEPPASQLLNGREWYSHRRQ
jgi:hypothetical protein